MADSRAVKLKAALWLQHVVDTSSTDRESSFSEFWATETARPWPALCCLCAVKPPTLGAHVMSMHAGIGVVIVPACAECNSNPTKATKFAEVKFDVWAARVTKSELQRIERQQRLNARHQRDEAKLALIRSLPEVGVPAKINPRRPSERGRHHRHECSHHFAEPCPCGRVQYSVRGSHDQRRQAEANDDDDNDDVPERTPTPRPPSPVSDPEVIDVRPLRPPVGSKPRTVAVSDEEERVTGILAKTLLMTVRPKVTAAVSPAVTPRPERRRLSSSSSSNSKPTAARASSSLIREQADAMQTIGRCKQILNEADDDDTDGLRFCNQATCSKRPECPGSSKGYCCLHCKCKHCVKPASVATAAAVAPKTAKPTTRK